MLRTYARAVGAGLLLFALAGFFYLPQLSFAESLFHTAVGVMFVYLGFLQRDLTVVRDVVGGLGLLLLAGKGVLVLAHLWWGEAHLFGPVELVCLAVGVASALAARLLPPGGRPLGGDRRGRR